MPAVVTDQLSVDVLTWLNSAPLNKLASSKLRLFKSNTTPTRNSVAGDFTEADFTGYALVVITTWVTVIDAILGPYLLGPLVAFTTGAGPVLVPNDVYGWYLTDNAGVLLMAERFPDFVTVSAIEQVVPVLPTFGAVTEAS